MAGTISGQTLKKGTVIECSEITVTLHQNATLEQYFEILTEQMVPATELAFPGTEIFYAVGVRGNAESKVGAIWVFESAEIRSRYFDDEGKLTPVGEKASAELDPVFDRLEKIGTATRKSTEWMVINHPLSTIVNDYYEYLIEFCEQEDIYEVPIAPSNMGITDPQLEKLNSDLAETVAELIDSGIGENDPRFSEYSSRIKNLRRSLDEAATKKAETEKRAFQIGGSFGYHVLTISLAPEVTMEQYLEYLTKKYIPEVVKHFTGVEVVIMKPVRGAQEDQIAYVNYFRSERSRDQFWPEPDTYSQRAEEEREQVQPVLFELLKLGTWTDNYGVWVIQ